MQNIFNFAASMGRNVLFEEGFMWLFSIVSWAKNTEEDMQRLIEDLANIRENEGIFPSRSQILGDLEWQPVFSIGICVRKDLDFSTGPAQGRFWQIVNKYPALKEIMSHFNYLPNLYKNVGMQGHVGFGQYSSLMKRSKQIVGDGWLVIGDAAGHVNPFLSTGVNYGCGEAYHAAHDISCALSVRGPFVRRMFKGFEAYSNKIYSTLSMEMEMLYRSFQCPPILERMMAYKFGWLVFDLLSRNDYEYVAGDAQTFELLHPAYVQTLTLALKLVRAQRSTKEIEEGSINVDALSNQGINRNRTFSPALIDEMVKTINKKIEDNMQLLQLAQLRLSRFLDYYDDDLRRTDQIRKGESSVSATSLSKAASSQRFTLQRCTQKHCNGVNGVLNSYCLTCGTILPKIDMKLHDWTHHIKTDKPDFLQPGKLMVEQYKKALSFNSVEATNAAGKTLEKDVLILVGTQTFTSSSYAITTTKILEEAGICCTCTFLDKYRPENLIKETRNIVLITSTYGSGDPPANAIELNKFLSNLLNDRSDGDFPLKSLYYAVLALGNSSYANFCGFGSFVDNSLCSLGGVRINEIVLLDHARDAQSIFQRFLNQLKKNLLTHRDKLVPAVNSRIQKMAIPNKAMKRFEWEIVRRQELTSLKVHKTNKQGIYEYQTVHLELTTEAVPPEKNSGDHISIIPTNDEALVLKVATFFEVPLAKNVEVKTLDGISTISTTVKEYLSNMVDLTSSANRLFWSRIISRVAQNDACLKARLEKLLELQSMLEELEKNTCQDEMPSSLDDVTRTACEVDALDSINRPDHKMLLAALSQPSCEIYKFLKFPLALSIQSPLLTGLPLTLSQFMDLAPRSKARLYSLTAPLSADKKGGVPPSSSQRIALCVSQHRSIDPVTGVVAVVQTGHCSTHLTKLQIGDKIKIDIIRNPIFKIPKDFDESTPLVLIATGTGISPLRGFMVNRLKLFNSKPINQSWYLFYGCRSIAAYLYQWELDYYKKIGILKNISVAFSAEEGVPKQYVQDKVREEGKLVYETLQNKNGIVMVCGRATMMTAIRKLLPDIFVRCGSYSQQEASLMLQQLESSRRLLFDDWQ